MYPVSHLQTLQSVGPLCVALLHATHAAANQCGRTGMTRQPSQLRGGRRSTDLSYSFVRAYTRMPRIGMAMEPDQSNYPLPNITCKADHHYSPTRSHQMAEQMMPIVAQHGMRSWPRSSSGILETSQVRLRWLRGQHL